MAGNVVVEQSSVSVVPGETATCSVRVRNTGAVVDSFSLTVLGQPAAWTTVIPAALSLFPGADGNIELHFAPPRAASVGSGPQPFGVRVVGSEDADNPVVEEGEVNLLPFVEVAAKLTPRTSETKRKARHEVILDNKGNAPISVALAVSDPDEQLAFELRDSSVTVDAGQAVHVPLKVAARKGFARGADKHRPFQVKVTPAGAGYPTQLDGNLIQKPGLPKFILPLAAAVVAVVVLAAILPSVLKKDGGKGNLQLTSEQAATSTTAAPAADDGGGDDPNAPATAAEQEAAAAAELAANGKDPDAPTAGSAGGSGGGGATAAGAGGGSAAGGGSTATTSLSDNNTPGTTASPTATTAPPPPSVTTTSAAPATTTTTSASDVDTYNDLKQENAGQAHYHYIGGGTIGQVVRANAPYLTEVWFNLSGTSVAANIRKGGPGGAIVASSPATAITQYGWTKITFPRVPLTVGQPYYIEGVGSGNVYAWYSNTNDYPDGDAYLNGAVHNSAGHGDLNLRVISRTG